MSDLSHKDTVDKYFATHLSPDTEQFERGADIRKAGGELARVILDSTNRSADQSAAIRKVREAVMTAEAAIVCHEDA